MLGLRFFRTGGRERVGFAGAAQDARRMSSRKCVTYLGREKATELGGSYDVSCVSGFRGFFTSGNAPHEITGKSESLKDIAYLHGETIHQWVHWSIVRGP